MFIWTARKEEPLMAHASTYGGHAARPTWRTVNISSSERWARVILGAVGAIIGIFLLTSATSILAAVLEVLLVLAGADLVITGTLGHCPLYQRLGHIPRSLRGA